MYTGDLTKKVYTGDVASVRLCDFSSDEVGNIGKLFTLSSQGKICVKFMVTLVLLSVEPGCGVGWVGRSCGDKGLRNSPWISESDWPK
jgi:hypothetical protein